MAFKIWNDDDPKDRKRIADNALSLLSEFKDIPRTELLQSQLKAWHTRLYYECSVPNPNYVGHFRGDEIDIDLRKYRVTVGRAKEGVWPAIVQDSMDDLFIRLNTALAYLDGLIPGEVSASENVAEVVRLTGIAHGEIIRIHPFANGNGRLARMLANYIALRYGLPAFVTVKPRPASVMYASAAEKSMGGPPSFRGDHQYTIAVFHNMLAKALGQHPVAESEPEA